MYAFERIQTASSDHEYNDFSLLCGLIQFDTGGALDLGLDVAWNLETAKETLYEAMIHNNTKLAVATSLAGVNVLSEDSVLNLVSIYALLVLGQSSHLDQSAASEVLTGLKDAANELVTAEKRRLRQALSGVLIDLPSETWRFLQNTINRLFGKVDKAIS